MLSKTRHRRRHRTHRKESSDTASDVLEDVDDNVNDNDDVKINPPQSLTCTSTWWGGERQSKGVLVKAMPSVKKASAEVSPWALREVDRLNKNPEKKRWLTQAVKTSAVLLLNLEN